MHRQNYIKSKEQGHIYRKYYQATPFTQTNKTVGHILLQTLIFQRIIIWEKKRQCCVKNIRKSFQMFIVYGDRQTTEKIE